MKLSKAFAVCSAIAVCGAMTISASASSDLTRTDSANKFTLGSDEVGGSGVEPTGATDGKTG